MLLHWSLPRLAVAFCHFSLVLSQTYTKCDPLKKSCPPNPALGKSVTFDLTKGPPADWPASKDIKYDGNGGSFTINKDGVKAEIQSNFYIMFGKIEATLKVSPGKGIVSSVVVQSECGDEIDLEWIGGDNMQLQTNYYAKRNPDHTRAGYHPNPNNQNEFRTYTVDWDSDRIIWQIDGETIRVATSAAGNYPQTPSYIKVGNWAGGDPSQNPPGTVQWAGGPVDYSLAPFTMQIKSIKVTDYSTGKQYEYKDKTGNWQSIEAVDGKVNSHNPGDDTETPSTTTTSTTASTTATPTQTNCGPKESSGAICTNEPSASRKPTPTGTDSSSGGDQAKGTESAPTPSDTNVPSGASTQGRMQLVAGVACILFSALMATF
ncbi:cell wall glucanase [Histoplasma ohiense]|nr:cell wall glucanase [Histoplasma ohiense (nom. inval.)]